MHDAVAPVAAIASATLANTGMPSTSVPAFFGLVPADDLRAVRRG